jgi:uncharacterized damage-inducible protein DinB
LQTYSVSSSGFLPIFILKEKTNTMNKIYKPDDGYDAFYQSYMDCVPADGNLLQHLKDIMEETGSLVINLSEEKLNYRYSEGKWTIKDIILHLADCERIIIYRVLRIARGDKTNLPGFDENLFVSTANAGSRTIEDIMEELFLSRQASIFFIGTLSDEVLDNNGIANGFALTARLLVNHLYGHHRHHLNIIRKRYLI